MGPSITLNIGRFTLEHAARVFSTCQYAIGRNRSRIWNLCINSLIFNRLKDQRPGAAIHSQTVGFVAVLVVDAINRRFPGRTRIDRDEVVGAALLHDVGKLPRNQEEEGVFSGADGRDSRFHPKPVGDEAHLKAIIDHPNRSVDLLTDDNNKIPGMDPSLMIRILIDIGSHHGTKMTEVRFTRDFSDYLNSSSGLEKLMYYAGPRPVTREAAILMIVDACEARLIRKIHEARTEGLPDPKRSLAAIRQNVTEKVIKELKEQGQLDESGIKDDELEIVAEMAAKGLTEVWKKLEAYDPEI